MPGLIRDRPSSQSSEVVFDAASTSHVRIIDDVEYPALSFPGYAEKPLSEQLEPIAVVGMGCRLPGGITSPAEFWDMMINKKTGQTPRVPASRFNIDAHFHTNNERPGSFNVLGGYFLDSSLQEFDPVLFGISPIEAMWMDPQQRKLLEVVYEAFESGGVTLDTLHGSKTAVFVGSFTSDFQQMSFKEPEFRHSYAATGVDPGIISNRIGHVFNLNGPSITVNTACSSSVYAMHNACNALRNNECSAAIVGGTNLVLTVDQHMNTAKLGVLSPTSTCRTFDETADGYGRADGVGAVYLKRLGDAVRDGDPIRGVIRSSAVNSNGRAPAVGITHPNLEGQEAVIRHAYERGGDFDPRLTGYFECHGTGTPIGDPLEVHAVANAMNENRLPGDEPLWIGAVKTNIGHSEAASGLSAVIKAVLTVEKGIIPPTRGVANRNPKIDWNGWQVDVVNDPTPFPSHLPVKRVSVNSFGYGGTNGHVIIESADSFLPSGPTHSDSHKKIKTPRGAFNRNRPFLLPFSAHDKVTLKRNITAYSTVASRYNILDLSHTLANRRSRLAVRGFVVANQASLECALGSNAEAFTFAEKKKTPTLGFIFTGQGAQWATMGSELMTYYPSFLRSIRLLDRALEDLPDGPEWTLEDTLLEDVQTSRVDEAEFSQPLCTAIQVAIVQLLALWGIKPVVTAGHSSGEIGAAFAAGLISANEAIIVAYYRGKVVRDVNTNGAMMAVGLGAEGIAPHLADVGGKVVIACHNSPTSVTLSGDADALEVVKTKLDAGKIFARMVKTGGKAYHSNHMKPVAAAYEHLVGTARAYTPLHVPTRSGAKMVSSVTNSIILEETIIDEAYWSANLRSPVLFNQAVQTIATSPEFAKVDMLIEIRPHSTLSGPIKQIKGELGLDKLGYLPSLLRGADSAAQLLKLAGELFLQDYPIDMDRVTAIEEPLPSGKIHLSKGSLLVDLPTYQWNYSKDLWAESRHSREHRAPQHARHDILGSCLPGTGEPIWRNMLRIRDVPWLKHHSIGGEAVFPAAGYFSMAMEAITQLNETSSNPTKIEGYVLRDISIKAALVTPDDDTGIEVIFSMRPLIHSEADTETQWWEFRASSISQDDQRKEHIAGSISVNARDRGQKPRELPNLPQRASGKSWSQGLREVGFDYGATFQDMNNIRSDGINYAAVCDTAVRTECGIMEGESRYAIHPGIIDSCLQLVIVSIYAGRLNDMTCGAVPIQVDEVAIWLPTAAQLKERSATAFSWTDQRGLRSFLSGSQLVASDGELLVDISDMRCTAYEAAVPQRAGMAMESQPYGEMVWKYDFDSLKANEDTTKLDMSSLVALAHHKNPGLKVIEIGSKHTGAVLLKSGTINYTSTETNDEAVEQIDAIVRTHKTARAQRLNVYQELQEQGVAGGSFDLVIASREMTESMLALRNIRKMLVSSGRVLWDLDGQPSSALLHGAGLSAFDLILGPDGKPAIAVSTAIETGTNGYTNGVLHQVQLVYRNKPGQVLIKVKSAFEMLGWHTITSSLEECVGKVGDHVVMLADFEGPLLASLEAEELSAIQSIINSVSSLLWVSPGGLLTGKHPEYAMSAGLARSITSEQIALNFTTLDFDIDNTSSQDVTSIITKIAQSQIHRDGIRESEYYVSKGLLHISRLVPNTDVNSVYSADKKEAESSAFDPDACLVGKVQSGKVVFEADARPKEPIGEDQVEVKVTVSGLNKEGILVISGSDYPTTFSHEIGGIVTKVGSKVSSLAAGDQVVGFNLDKFATFQRVPADLVKRLEDPKSLNSVVSLLMSHGAALYGLKYLAKLEVNETVLILEGAGLTGNAAIEITKLMEAIPYVAVSSETEAKIIVSRYGLPEKQVLLASEVSISAQLKALTGRDGADVVFSAGSANASLARESWRSIAPFGRFIDSGRKNVLKRRVVDTVPLYRSANYLSFDMLDLYKLKPKSLSKLLSRIISLYHQKSITNLAPITVKNITELDSAVASFSDDFSSGKTLIVYEPSETPLKVIPRRPTMKFRQDATYLLVGCLGGLGRSLTSWMMKHGARRFVFLSRSGTDVQQAAFLVRDIEAVGADVQVVRGDVTDKADVDRAVAGVRAEYPIRGVVQAAMVLKDGLFPSMSYANWKNSTSPKVQGTVNLHEALHAMPLDFFVMTSSVSGVLGTPGQSNYAAANSFLDSFARHRRSQGQKATSIVLPMVLGVGVVAENFEIEESLKRKGMYGIEEEALLETLEASIAIQATAGSADHVVAGMDPARLQKTMTHNATTDSFWMEDVRFAALLRTMRSSASSSAASGAQSILSTIKSSASPADAIRTTSEHFVEKLSRMLLVDMEDFEPDVKAVADYGLDSMIGAELRNWIFKEYALDIPFQQLLAPSLTVTKFAKLVCANQGIV